MRLLTAGVLTVGVAIAGCARNDGVIAKTNEADAAKNLAAAATTSPVSTSGAANPSAANAASPSNAASPAWREVTIPAGTSLSVVLDNGVGSDISRIESPVSAHLARPLVLGGRTVLPGGSQLNGVVTDATRSARVKGRAHVAIRFTTLTPRGDDERYRIRTATIGRTAPATKKKDALTIGAPAAGGAVVGGIIGGKKGAGIGALAGGGGGTAVVLSTRGKEVRMARGSLVVVRLTEPVTVRVRG